MSTDSFPDTDPSPSIGSTETIHGTATALSQIHSGGDAEAGNRQLVRVEKIYRPDRDRFVNVGHIAGNSVRGHLRRILAGDLLRRLDYTITDERQYHLLRAGGVLEEGGKAEIDVGLRREVRDVFPIIDLLGGSTGNQMFEGTVNVHHMTLVCEENDWRTRADGERSKQPWREFVDDLHQTRMHDHPDDTDMDVDFGFDRDAGDDDAEATDDPGSQQMIYHVVAIVPGAQFEHSVRLESHATELTRACLLHGLRLWRDDGTIGGMSAAGLGRVDISYDADLSAGDRYTEYVAEHGGAIIEALDTLASK